MRFLFDITHPAVVHIYLPVIEELRRRGHEFSITSRDKDLTTTLLDQAGLSHSILTRSTSGRFRMAIELMQREVGVLKEALKFKPHLIAGTSANAARVAKILGVRSVINNEDDAAMVPLFRWTAYPCADAIVTPWVLEFENHGRRHLTYPSFEKLFYLHPYRFAPDTAIKELLSKNSPDGRYLLFRFSALKAHHDVGAKGLSQELVDRLLHRFGQRTNIWISSEKPLPNERQRFAYPLPILTMHHALAQCSALISDSQSMSVEAAVLGVKSFRLNSFVGKLSVLNELDRRGLSEGFLPGAEDSFEKRVIEYFDCFDAETSRQKERRANLLAETIDPVPWYVDVLERMASGAPLEEVYAMDGQFVPPAIKSLGSLPSAF